MATLKIDLVVDDKGKLVITGFGQHVDKVMWSAGNSVASFGKQLAIGTAALSAVGAAGGVLAAQFIGIADTYTMIEGRLKLVTDSTAQLNRVQEALYRTSLATHQGMEGTADLYTGLARSTKDLGVSEERLLAITANMNQAFVVSGASQESAGNGMRQLTQAMYGGTVRAEEFNSILENTPRVAQAVAEGLGLSMGQLRQEMLDGKLSAERFLEGFEKGSAKINEEFKKMPITTKMAVGDLKTVFQSIIDGANDTTGTTGKISGAIENLATTIDTNREQIISLFTSLIEGAGTAVDKTIAVGSAIVEFKEKIDSLANTGNIAAPSAMEYGVIGAVLLRGGPGAAGLTAALITINNQLGQMGMNIGSLPGKLQGSIADFGKALDGLTGKRDFNTGAIVSEIEQIDKKIAALKNQKEPWQLFPDPAETRRHAREISDSIADLEKQKAEAINAEIAGEKHLADALAASQDKIDKNKKNVPDSGKKTGGGTSAKTKDGDEAKRLREIEALVQKRQELEDKLTRDMAANAEKQGQLQLWLDGTTRQSVTSLYETKKTLHEQEYRDAKQLAAGSIEAMQRVEEWHNSSLATIALYDEQYSADTQQRLEGMKDSWMVLAEMRATAMEGANGEAMRLDDELTVYLENSGDTRLASALARLEKEYRKKKEIAGDDMELQQKVADWYKSKHEEIVDSADTTFKELGNMIDGWGRQASDSFVEFAMTGKASFKDMVRSMLADLAKLLFYQSVVKPLVSGMTGMLGGFSGMAEGGPVSAGGFYEVNERRPELLNIGNRQFLMMGSRDGVVDPNLGGVGVRSRSDGGGLTINVPVSVEGNSRLAGELQRRIEQVVLETLRRST